MVSLLILVPSVLLDLLLGDPPNAFHPVAWMGKLISVHEKAGLKLRPAVQFSYGVMAVLAVTVLCAAAAFWLLYLLGAIGQLWGILASVVVLKLMFSVRGLRQSALKIKRLLENQQTAVARRELRDLVSRDTAELDEPMLVSSAVESVAEGACDSFVAPVFYFLAFSVPGAVAYRVVNTFDAMIGYRGKYEHLGKFAARLDDILNYIPARLTALLLVLAAFLAGKDGRQAWRVAWRQHGRTESPNAGWPMAAMAGALGVRLEKPGHYQLGEGNARLTPDTIEASLRIFQTAVALVVGLLMTGVVYFAITA